MIEMTTVARGEGSGVATPRRVIVRDDASWRRLWAEHAGSTAAAPAVDFSTAMIAAVFAGDRPSPGHAIEITEAEQQGDGLSIAVVESRPAAGIVAPQLIVTPFHIVALPRFDGAVSFTHAA